MTWFKYARLVVPLLATLILSSLAGPVTPLQAAEDAGQADLDKAIDAKLAAENLKKLGEVIKLCESALDKGLDEENRKFAETLLSSTLYQRGSVVAGAILGGQPGPEWPQLRQAALADLERAVKYDQNQPEAHLQIAKLHSLPGGDRKRAMAALDEGIKVSEDGKPEKHDYYTLRAALQETDEARLADLNKAIELFPDSPDPRRVRGAFYLSQQKPEEALADFDEALKIDPEHAASHEARGLALAALKRFDEARESYQKAADLAPNSPEPYLQRARISFESGDIGAALTDINKALEIDPKNLSALLMRAQAHIRLDELEKALEDCNAALEAQPGLIVALRLRAVILASLEKYDEAIADLERVRREDPRDEPTLLQLAMIYNGALKKPAKAIEIYDEIVENNDESAQGYRGRADALLSIGKQKEAIADYEAALKLDPQDSGILNNLAWVLATSPDDSLRDGKRSLELAIKACEATEYKQAHILSTLAASHAENGDFKSAIEWSKKAVEIGDEDVKENLLKELKTYEEGKPMREIQNVTAEEAPAQEETEEEDTDKVDAAATDTEQ